MADDDRLKRAGEKFTREDASILRAMVHGWLNVDELVLVSPAGIAHQILAVLDALAIVHGNEREMEKVDEVLRRVNAFERAAEEQHSNPSKPRIYTCTCDKPILRFENGAWTAIDGGVIDFTGSLRVRCNACTLWKAYPEVVVTSPVSIRLEGPPVEIGLPSGTRRG